MAATGEVKVTISGEVVNMNLVIAQQRAVIVALQKNLLDGATVRRPSGDLRDVATALAMSIDKLALLMRPEAAS